DPKDPALPPPGEPDRGAEVLRREVRVTNPSGFHLRPAAAFAQLARQFAAAVTVRRGEKRVNGKSWPDLLLLGAEHGTELVLEVSGEDGPAALEALAELLASGGSEELLS
ncbi:MAG TPA: HPr family phosphocarrier protein, partial [Gemmataceae bacterium]